MRQNRRPMLRAAGVAESASAAEVAAAVATTTRATQASRASTAGRTGRGMRLRRLPLVIELPQPQLCTRTKREVRQPLSLKFTIGDRECQYEVDQVLLNARKNTRASKNSATKPSEGFNAKPRNLWERQAIRTNWT